MTTEDPQENLHPQPPYSDKQQSPPGNEEEMSPRRIMESRAIKAPIGLKVGSALITGADSGIGTGGRSRFRPRGSGCCHLLSV